MNYNSACAYYNIDDGYCLLKACTYIYLQRDKIYCILPDSLLPFLNKIIKRSTNIAQLQCSSTSVFLYTNYQLISSVFFEQLDWFSRLHDEPLNKHT